MVALASGESKSSLLPRYRIPVELLGVASIVLTAYLRWLLKPSPLLTVDKSFIELSHTRDTFRNSEPYIPLT